MGAIIFGDGEIPLDEVPGLETDWCLALQLDHPQLWAAASSNGLVDVSNETCYILYNHASDLDVPEPIGPPVADVPALSNTAVGLGVFGILLTILLK